MKAILASSSKSNTTKPVAKSSTSLEHPSSKGHSTLPDTSRCQSSKARSASQPLPNSTSFSPTARALSGRYPTLIGKGTTPATNLSTNATTPQPAAGVPNLSSSLFSAIPSSGIGLFSEAAASKGATTSSQPAKPPTDFPNRPTNVQLANAVSHPPAESAGGSGASKVANGNTVSHRGIGLSGNHNNPNNSQEPAASPHDPTTLSSGLSIFEPHPLPAAASSTRPVTGLFANPPDSQPRASRISPGLDESKINHFIAMRQR